jgi:ATP-binding cassette, subfamily F, member 3
LKKTKNTNSTKVLNAPINLNELAAQHTDLEEIKSIWVTSRDDSLKVDAKKLEKAKAKIQQKQEKRNDVKVSYNQPILQTASASQVVSKKDNKLESKVWTLSFLCKLSLIKLKLCYSSFTIKLAK